VLLEPALAALIEAPRSAVPDERQEKFQRTDLMSMIDGRTGTNTLGGKTVSSTAITVGIAYSMCKR
jgi:hypothetical protein